MRRGRLFHGSRSFVSRLYFRFAEQVVDTRIIIPCKLNQNCRGDIVFPCFVFGISRLRHSEHFRYLCLIHIFVFSQISYSRIHFSPLFFKINSEQQLPTQIILNLFWGIDFYPVLGYNIYNLPLFLSRAKLILFFNFFTDIFLFNIVFFETKLW